MREPAIVDLTIDLDGHRSHRGVSRFLRDHGIRVKNLDVARAFNLLADGYPVESVCQALRVRQGHKTARAVEQMAVLIREGKHLVTKGGKR